MYLKFDKDSLTDEQLIAIKEILGCKIQCLYNVHYEACKFEIECLIENELSMEEMLEAKNNSRFNELVEEYAFALYNRSDYQWDCLYDKAIDVVDIDKFYGLLEEDI